MLAGKLHRPSLCVALALAMAAALSLAPARAMAQALVVLSDESAAYEAVASELRTGLSDARSGTLRLDLVTSRELARMDPAALQSNELVVTVGLAAAQAVVGRGGVAGPPMLLALLIPRQGYERLPARPENAGRRSAVFIDQPLSRQLDLLRVALPGKTRIGAVLGPSSRELRPDLSVLARERGLSLSLASVDRSSTVYAALRSVIPRSDLLLLLPDPVATSVDSVHGLLLTSYRAQVPVIGYSEGLAKAGALLSLYSSATQQGRQGAEIARRVLAGGDSLPAPTYPRYFTVRINPSVARSLAIALPSEQVLAEALRARQDGDRDAPRAGDAGQPEQPP